MKTLTEMLTEREAIAQLCETILDEGTEHCKWSANIFSINDKFSGGVKVERVEVKDIRLPQQLTRAMAAEAEVRILTFVYLAKHSILNSNCRNDSNLVFRLLVKLVPKLWQPKVNRKHQER